jgi:hypothetical protein
MTRQELLSITQLLSATPESIRQIVQDCAAESLTRRPPSGEFAAVEVICHLRDLEREGYAVRIQRLLAEQQPSLPDIDGGRLAIERDYLRQNFANALHDFGAARKDTIRAISDLTPEQWECSGTQEGVGPVTVARVLEMMLEHDEGHLEELRRLCSC